MILGLVERYTLILSEPLSLETNQEFTIISHERVTILSEEYINLPDDCVEKHLREDGSKHSTDYC